MRVRPRAERTITATHTSQAAGASCRVVVLWRGGYAARELPAGSKLAVGRGTDCDVAVDDASVSRRHVVVHGGPPHEIEDLGSSNGTRIGGARLPPGHRTTIAPGTVVEIGSATLLIQRAGSRERPAEASGADSDAEAFIESVARSSIHVLILGETGSGKEVMAERIHGGSARARKPLVKLNCAALPETLLESELFGHEKGAFTGATHAKPGLLESGDGGTLLLDEVGELPLATQAKLLRVLENGEVTRLGSVRPRSIDLRVLSATHRDLGSMIEAGTFRRDLYFRLDGVTVVVAPLRERIAEIAALARGFLARADDRERRRHVLTPSAVTWLESYAWPGNVRELKLVMERVAALCHREDVGAEDLEGMPWGPAFARSAAAPTPQAKAHGSADDAPGNLRGAVDAFERERIVTTLEQCGGNQSRAARMLGLSRRSLLRRLDEYGVPRPRKGG
jgi:transcriptional regulator with GAF, ATPase, and Fis domain